MEAKKVLEKMIKRLNLIEEKAKEIVTIKQQLQAEVEEKIKTITANYKGFDEYFKKHCNKYKISFHTLDSLINYIEYEKKDVLKEFQSKLIIEDKKEFLREFASFLNKTHKTNTYHVKTKTKQVKRFHYRDDSHSTETCTYDTLLNNYVEVLEIDIFEKLYYPLNYTEYEKFNMDYSSMFIDTSETEQHKKYLKDNYEKTPDFKLLQLGDEKAIKQFALNYIIRKNYISQVMAEMEK